MDSALIGVILAVIAALAGGIESLVRRKAAIKFDTLWLTFIFESFAAIFLLPPFILSFQMPKNNYAWLLILVSGIIWAAISFLFFKAYSYLQASSGSLISRAKVLLILLFSVIFLGENLNAIKIVGTLLIFFGLVVLSYKKGGQILSFSDKGVRYLIIATVLTSIVFLIDKVALRFFNPGTMAFLLYLIPSLVLMPLAIKKGFSFSKINLKHTAFLAFLSAVFYYSTLYAFTFAEVSIVVPITDLSSLVSVFGGILILGEKDHVPKKVLSAIPIILGAILIGLS